MHVINHGCLYTSHGLLLRRSIIAVSQGHVSSAVTETEDDEAIAMAALSTLADSGTHLMSHLTRDTGNCTIAVDLSSSHTIG